MDRRIMLIMEAKVPELLRTSAQAELRPTRFVNPSSSDQKGFLDHAVESFLLCNELVERQHAFSGT